MDIAVHVYITVHFQRRYISMLLSNITVHVFLYNHCTQYSHISLHCRTRLLLVAVVRGIHIVSTNGLDGLR